MQIKDFLSIFLPIIPLVLCITACEDPSNVGLGLLEDAGGIPVVEEVPITAFDPNPVEGITSGTTEMLTGRINHPVLGEFTASGYIDFFSGVLPDEYESGEVDTVFLRLQPNYLYGDTLQDIVIDVYEVMEEFNTLGLTKDSLPPVGMNRVFQFSFSPTDTLVNAAFPSEWIMQKNTVLRSSSFSELFFGLKLVPVEGNAVIGFLNTAASLTALRGIAFIDQDTFQVNYPAQKSITEFTRLTEPQLPAGRKLVQQGIGPNLRVDFDLMEKEDLGLNRAALRLQVDSTAIGNTPDFFRPAFDNLALVGVFEDSTVFTINNNVSVSADGSVTFESIDFRSFIQQALLGNDLFDHYEIRFPSSTSINTVNAIVFHDTTSVSAPPSLILTYTSLE